MKAQERHHLKQNEFATTVARVSDSVRGNPQRIMMWLVAAVAVVAVVGGYFWWRGRQANEAGAVLASAMVVMQSPIVPAPTLPGATQAPGTFASAAARQEAALGAFQKVAAAYPSRQEGLAAASQAAALLYGMGRHAEAEKAYADLIARAGGTSVYGMSARLGLAQSLAAQTKYDAAIKEYTDLAALRDGLLPVDGVLVELARTYLKAGKRADARATFKRVVDEFPTSVFVSEAREQMAALS
jgi:tetratricopeptide (TPR) repeat protein